MRHYLHAKQLPAGIAALHMGALFEPFALTVQLTQIFSIPFRHKLPLKAGVVSCVVINGLVI
jgi:hypothetical protein